MASRLTIITEETLRRFDRGALDPQDRQEVEAVLEADPQARAYLQALQTAASGQSATGSRRRPASKRKGDIMSTDLKTETQARLEVLRGELERMRGEARKLQGEARLEADQHVNKLQDQLDELERNARTTGTGVSEAASALADGASKAWEDIATAAKKAGQKFDRRFENRD